MTSPDLIGRDFTATAPGTRLVGDITYLKTGEGWLYLATVIDLATRMVTGWQLASHMRTSLVTDALAMAISHGHIAPGAVFHSDKGTHLGGVHPVLPGSRRPDQHRPHRRVLGQRRRRKLLRRLEERDVSPAGLPHRARRGSPSPTTSRSSTTASGCTPPSATAPQPRYSPNSRPQQPLHDQLPEELSKIVDTPHPILCGTRDRW